MIDVWLKITGTKKQARDALKTLGLDKEMVRRNDAGKLELVGYNHHVAMEFIPNLITAFGTYDGDGNQLTAPVFDGPHLMIRFVSKRVLRKIKDKFRDGDGNRLSLPPGLEVVDAPTTLVWA